MAAGLVDLAVQAVDGSKVAGNASPSRTLDEARLQRLLERTETAIADLEAQNTDDGPPAPPRLPEQLRHAQALRARVHEALARVAADEGTRRVNLTDGDAVLQRIRSGYLVGYNAQAVASPLTPGVSSCAGSRTSARSGRSSPRPSTCVSWLTSGNR